MKLKPLIYTITCVLGVSVCLPWMSVVNADLVSIENMIPPIESAYKPTSTQLTGKANTQHNRAMLQRHNESLRQQHEREERYKQNDFYDKKIAAVIKEVDASNMPEDTKARVLRTLNRFIATTTGTEQGSSPLSQSLKDKSAADLNSQLNAIARSVDENNFSLQSKAIDSLEKKNIVFAKDFSKHLAGLDSTEFKTEIEESQNILKSIDQDASVSSNTKKKLRGITNALDAAALPTDGEGRLKLMENLSSLIHPFQDSVTAADAANKKATQQVAVNSFMDNVVRAGVVSSEKMHAALVAEGLTANSGGATNIDPVVSSDGAREHGFRPRSAHVSSRERPHRPINVERSTLHESAGAHVMSDLDHE